MAAGVLTRMAPALGLLAAALLALGWPLLTALAIDPSAERSVFIAAIWNHVGAGVVMAPAVLGWAAWRGYVLRRDRGPARLAGGLLVAAALFLVITGPLVVWSFGPPLTVFDWFAVPNPIGKRPVFHDAVEAAHGLVAHALPVLVLLDVALAARRRRAS